MNSRHFLLTLLVFSGLHSLAVGAIRQGSTEVVTHEGTAGTAPLSEIQKTTTMFRFIQSLQENRSVLPLEARAQSDWESHPVPSLFPALPQSSQRSWIKRHPVLFGTLVGFGSGFLIGVAAGDDAVIEDFTAPMNGWFLGAIGAGGGAVIGFVLSR
jgi:hypothetical protein